MKNVAWNLRSDKIIDQIYIKYYSRPNLYAQKQISDIFYSVWSPYRTNKFILYCKKINPKFRFYENIHAHILDSICKPYIPIPTDREVFGFYPFNLTPRKSNNLLQKALWEKLYNIQRLYIKSSKMLLQLIEYKKDKLYQKKWSVNIL